MLLSVLHPGRLVQTAYELTTSLYRRRQLLGQQIKQELFQQHVGQSLGSFWLFAHPLFMISIYVFVFGVVFKARIGTGYDMPRDYTTYIMSGLIPWLAILQTLSKSTSSLIANASLIKQVIFPIEVLPAKTVATTFLPLGLMLSALMLYELFMNGSLPWTYILLPFVLFLHVLWMMGIGFILSSIAVFVRDVRELVQMLALAGVFMLPIIYLPTWVPSAFQPILYLNPLSHLIWVYQDVLYFGRIEHPISWGISFVMGVLLYLFGARIFYGLKPHFGDVL